MEGRSLLGDVRVKCVQGSDAEEWQQAGNAGSGTSVLKGPRRIVPRWRSLRGLWREGLEGTWG